MIMTKLESWFFKRTLKRVLARSWQGPMVEQLYAEIRQAAREAISAGSSIELDRFLLARFISSSTLIHESPRTRYESLFPFKTTPS